jgi:hypothetical protein
VAIAKFLGFQTPEIFWLVRKLNFEYDKLFPEKIELPKNFIEQIARISTLTIYETRTSDFATNVTKDIINNTINNISENDDIISIADTTSPEMDILEEDDMDSSSINIYKGLPHLPTVSTNNAINSSNDDLIISDPSTRQSRKQSRKQNKNASNNIIPRDNNNLPPISSNTNTDASMHNIDNSMHHNILNKDDLRYTLNHTSHTSSNNNNSHVIATVLANVLPGDNRFDQLSLINTCFSNKPGFINLDWKFYNGNANIFIEFNNRKLLLSAIDEVLMTHPNIPFNILNHDTPLPSNPNAPIYRLKTVPITISHQHIKRALS